jgi:hypothetical protein
MNAKLPDTRDYTDRVEIRSQTSKSVYIVARHKVKGHWSCSCFGWITHRTCKHLKEMGLPTNGAPDVAVHKTYEGEKGSPEQWRGAIDSVRPAGRVAEPKKRRLEQL